MSSVLLGTWERKHSIAFDFNPDTAITVQAHLLDNEFLAIRISPAITDNEFAEAFFGLSMANVRIITTPQCVQYTMLTALIVGDANIGEPSDTPEHNTLYGALNHAVEQMLTQYYAILDNGGPGEDTIVDAPDNFR